MPNTNLMTTQTSIPAKTTSSFDRIEILCASASAIKFGSKYNDIWPIGGFFTRNEVGIITRDGEPAPPALTFESSNVPASDKAETGRGLAGRPSTWKPTTCFTGSSMRLSIPEVWAV
eukprot:scaffold531620_cov41-Prasinocladus_malaysianus.AAC.1